MTFFSLKFLIFLLIVFVLYYLIPRKYRYIYLAFSGIVFYACQGIRFLIILMSVVLISYISSFFVKSAYRGRYVLGSSVILLIILWLLFRTDGFGRGIAFFSGGAAVGISFYTLSSIGYLFDIYRDKAEPERNFLKYMLFISFFPIVTSGPIERAGNLLDQIRRGGDFSYDMVKRGAVKILYGIFLKCLIADRMILMVNGIYDNYEVQTGAALFIGIILYGIQLYADFFGYTSIAVGLSMLFGFTVTENFTQPFFSRNIKDFWARWHISLSTWLRDYIYIPLGGNRKGRPRQYINLFVTFLLSGLWHGSGMQFVVWGLLHGLYQVTYSVSLPVRKACVERFKIDTESLGSRMFQAVFTALELDFSLLFFRTSSLGESLEIIKIIFTDFKLGKTLVSWLYSGEVDFERNFILMGEIIAWFMISLLHERNISIASWLDKQKKLFRWIVYTTVCIILITGMLYNYGTDTSAFIYAGF